MRQPPGGNRGSASRVVKDPSGAADGSGCSDAARVPQVRYIEKLVSKPGYFPLQFVKVPVRKSVKDAASGPSQANAAFGE